MALVKANGHNHFGPAALSRWTVSRRAEADFGSGRSAGAHGLSGDDFGQVTLAERGDGGNHLLRQKCHRRETRAGRNFHRLPSNASRLSQIQRAAAALASAWKNASQRCLFLLQPGSSASSANRRALEWASDPMLERYHRGFRTRTARVSALHHRDAILAMLEVAQQGIDHFQSHRARGPAADERNVEAVGGVIIVTK